MSQHKREGSRLITDYDTIIIGGGIVGNTIAYHLSERSDEGIVVIDRQFPMSGTSGANQAWVWVHTKGPAEYALFNKRSAELYPLLQSKIGDIEYQRTGGISPFFDPDERDQAFALVERQAKVGIDVRVLSAEDVLALEPAFSPGIAGATYSDIDGNVNPLKLVSRLMQEAERQGVYYHTYNNVFGIERQQGSFIVTSDQAIYKGKRLILAAGPWSREVGRLLGVDIPIRPVRGQILVTEKLPPLFRYTINGIRQTKSGEVLIGYSEEDAGYDNRNTLDVVQRTAQMAIRYAPSLASANIIRCFAGIRAIPEDELPILGSIPGMDNAFVAAMHSGITLAPLVGKLMAELILDGETSISIEDYSLMRFSHVP